MKVGKTALYQALGEPAGQVEG
ncbi:hypothetical protein IL54_1056 [Sphingobium sp. ba1]|nr:hypothetical protein IL54_1056 [Sphingobium sp. ba1]